MDELFNQYNALCFFGGSLLSWMIAACIAKTREEQYRRDMIVEKGASHQQGYNDACKRFELSAPVSTTRR